MKIKFVFLLIVLLIISSCSKKEPEVDIIIETKLDEQMVKAYTEGMEAIDEQDYPLAAVKFSEAEILYPQSLWAPRSALMTAYSYYLNQNYLETIFELDRYLKSYPLHNRKSYAFYLMALAYYEQIVDEKKDLEPIINSKKYFQLVIKEYPDSEFAVDAEYKLELIEDFLASKEMYLGRYYIERGKWIPAINRFKTVVEKYDRTLYVQEALHRLVEINYKIGLVDEAKKYASVLGYNYQSSQWYEKTYIIFNKDYEKPIKKIERNKKKSLLQKFKSLLD